MNFPDLSHHRTYGSVYGLSLIHIWIPGRFCKRTKVRAGRPCGCQCRRELGPELPG